MAEATFVSAFMQPYWGSDGRRYFVVSYNASNFNDTSINCRYPTGAFSDGDAIGANVIVTGVSFQYATSVGAVLRPYITVSGDPLVYVQLCAYATAYALDYHHIQCEVPLGPTLTANNALLGVLPSGYAATDDLLITIIGYLQSTASQPHPLPVSLEGYKWPLNRR
jgi:hypothetical protein